MIEIAQIMGGGFHGHINKWFSQWHKGCYDFNNRMNRDDLDGHREELDDYY